jgi:signal transduction histidine kinase
MHSRFFRLDLHAAKWLAAFGFARSLHGELFIPIHGLFKPGCDFVLRILHLIIHPVVCLPFEFGVALLPVGGAALAAWRICRAAGDIFLTVSFSPARSSAMLARSVNALARYMIGFTGGMLAYGLRQRAPTHCVSAYIVQVLQFAGIMLAFYAVFGGLIPSPIPYFPGSVINSASFESVVGIPVIVFRSIFGLGLAIAITRALEVFDVETARMIESIEQQQILAVERNRLARDLHDGAIKKYGRPAGRRPSWPIRAPNFPTGWRARRANDAIRRSPAQPGRSEPDHADERTRHCADGGPFSGLVDVSVDLQLPR